MINKIVAAEKAVAGVKEGMTIMIAGFLGTGTPEVLIDALVSKGVGNLTIIANDGGLPAGTYGQERARGVGKLLEKGMVKHIIASHVGMNPLIGEGMVNGTLQCTLVPQGTLAEKVRAAAYGMGAVLTTTGVGTQVQDTLDERGSKKELVVIQGVKYLLEMPLRADYSLIRASVADKFGNYMCAKATKNFNYVMAGAADKTIIAPEKLVEVGEEDPDKFAIAGVLVDAIVEGEKKWQI